MSKKPQLPPDVERPSKLPTSPPPPKSQIVTDIGDSASTTRNGRRRAMNNLSPDKVAETLRQLLATVERLEAAITKLDERVAQLERG